MNAPAAQSAVRHWWGQRWLSAFDELPAAAARRVQRGRALARRGAVEDLRVEPGLIGARVVEDRAHPLEVALRWPVASDERWERAVDALGSQLRFAAALLDGDLPEELADTLAEVGVTLLPSADALDSSCPCAERGQPCRHVAAVHAAVAVAIDRDPLLLLELRGRHRDQLLRLLRTGRDQETVVTGVDGTGDLESPRGDLEAIELRPAPVEDPSAAFERLGPPPGVDDPTAVQEIIERAAAGAWRLAAGEGSEAADEELLLTELRAQRMASAASLAEALGQDEDVIREHLDRLFDDGIVLRTGSGDRARYRAASA